ncbi:MAG TPA: hypothetical protein VHU91_07025 [Mycobacteriales bacterium]|jgi:hypothetical protein|nr:hypothetical protein [Mycobacteriales bacterium]
MPEGHLHTHWRRLWIHPHEIVTLARLRTLRYADGRVRVGRPTGLTCIYG